MPVLKPTDKFIRLEEGGPWYEVRRVSPAAAYVRKAKSEEMRTIRIEYEWVTSASGQKHRVPLAEPKEVLVPESRPTFSISAQSFIAEAADVIELKERESDEGTSEEASEGRPTVAAE
jgi:hypothetical protein